VSGARPVKLNGLGVAGVPTVASVGAGEPAGKTKISNEVAFAGDNHVMVAEFVVTVVAAIVVDLGHGGAGAQVTFAINPEN
jgi:hypothetical protein